MKTASLKRQLARIRAPLGRLEQRLQRGTGFTRLCAALAAIGTTLSLGGAAATFWLMHEPMESLGGAVVQHLAASNCTAINQVMAGLSLTRLDSVLHDRVRERGSPPFSEEGSSFGVINLDSGALEGLDSPIWPADAVLAQLRRLPLTASPPTERADGAASEGELSLQRFGCPHVRFELSPERVRVYPIAAPPTGQGWDGRPWQPRRPRQGRIEGGALAGLPVRPVARRQQAQDLLRPGGPGPTHRDHQRP